MPEADRWFLSVNNYRYFSHITATKNNNTFSATANYVLRDFYDFDPTSGGFFEDLAFSQLDNLNKTGHARCYKVIGVHNTGNWTLESRIY